jgi:transposase
LLPPDVVEQLDSDHLCFFVRQVVRRLDLSAFEKSYVPEVGMLYAPALMLSLWLYGYATGMTSARRLSQRLGEDLPLRYLAGGARVDNWALRRFVGVTHGR